MLKDVTRSLFYMGLISSVLYKNISQNGCNVVVMMKTIWVCEICGNVAIVEEGHTPDLEGCHEHNGRLGLHKWHPVGVERKVT
jgi:uncharacterized UBP type Zn finger protein